MSALYGPQHEYVLALIERARHLTEHEARSLAAAWEATGYAEWRVAWDAAWGTVRGAAWEAAWDAACEAALPAARYTGRSTRYAAESAAVALVVRDRISTEHYDTLTLPWRTVVGRIHPDDAEVTR